MNDFAAPSSFFSYLCVCVILNPVFLESRGAGGCFFFGIRFRVLCGEILPPTGANGRPIGDGLSPHKAMENEIMPPTGPTPLLDPTSAPLNVSNQISAIKNLTGGGRRGVFPAATQQGHQTPNPDRSGRDGQFNGVQVKRNANCIRLKASQRPPSIYGENRKVLARPQQRRDKWRGGNRCGSDPIRRRFAVKSGSSLTVKLMNGPS